MRSGTAVGREGLARNLHFKLLERCLMELRSGLCLWLARGSWVMETYFIFVLTLMSMKVSNFSTMDDFYATWTLVVHSSKFFRITDFVFFKYLKMNQWHEHDEVLDFIYGTCGNGSD